MSRPKAITTGTLAALGINADCYVLDNGQRVLSQRGIVRALTGGREGGNLGQYIARIPNGNALLTSGTEIEFEVNGAAAIGRPAEWFVDLLRAYKAAWRAGDLHHSQIKLALAADAMLDALAGVGITALIDEATGYESVRQHGDLARLFARLLLNKAQQWERMWPDDVVASLCRTYRIAKVGSGVPAPMMGVIGWIYRVVLGTNVHEEIRRRNPKVEDGERAFKHHQFMQDELRSLLDSDLRVIRALSDTSRDKEEFKAKLLSHYQRQPLQLELTGGVA